jgi:hypothetical protein
LRGGEEFFHSKDEDKKNILISFRLDLKASQIINIKIIRLIREIKDPIEEIIFHDKKVSG